MTSTALLLFLAIGLFIGAMILAVTRMVRTPGRGSWLLSVVCAVVLYWVLMGLLLLSVPHLGLNPASVRQASLGPLAFMFDLYTFGVPSFVALAVGVKLAPNPRAAFLSYGSLAVLIALKECLDDSLRIGHLTNVGVPVAAVIGVVLAGWLTKTLNRSTLDIASDPAFENLSEDRKNLRLERATHELRCELGQQNAQTGRSVWARPDPPVHSGDTSRKTVGEDANERQEQDVETGRSAWARPEPSARGDDAYQKPTSGDANERREQDVETDRSVWARPQSSTRGDDT